MWDSFGITADSVQDRIDELGIAIEPEIQVVGEGRPEGPAQDLIIQDGPRAIRLKVPPGLDQGQIERISDTMAEAARAMSYLPTEGAHDWPIYQQAIDELSALWAMPWAEAQEAFEDWVKGTVYSWPQAYWLAKARVAQGQPGPPKPEREG